MYYIYIYILPSRASHQQKTTESNQPTSVHVSSLTTVIQENKRLSEPLTIALTDVAELHAHLRGQEKDRVSLVNAKARLRVIDEQVGTGPTDDRLALTLRPAVLEKHGR